MRSLNEREKVLEEGRAEIRKADELVTKANSAIDRLRAQIAWHESIELKQSRLLASLELIRTWAGQVTKEFRLLEADEVSRSRIAGVVWLKRRRLDRLRMSVGIAEKVIAEHQPVLAGIETRGSDG